MATAQRTSAAGDTSPGSKLRRVIERIRAHLDQDLALAHLGAVVSMSPYHFARRFQHSTGLPPHRFVVCERIDRVVGLQAAPALSIAHISQVVGFCTPSHFSTVFRRITGVSPSAYRPVAARGRSEESGGRDGIA